MTEKALAVLTDDEKLELAEYLEKFPDILNTAGMDNVNDEDLARPPYLKVSSQNKPVEREDGETIPPGELVVMPDALIHGRTLDVVILVVTPPTFAYLAPYESGDPPYCLSDPTGKYPIPQGTGRTVTNPQAGPCRKCDKHGVPVIVCPRAQWGTLDEATGKNEKPECQKQLGFVLWLIDQDNDGVAFRTHRTANRYCGEHLNTLAIKVGVRHRITMTTRKVEGETGNKWWVPIASKGKRLTQAELLQAIRLKKEWESFLPAADFDHDDFDNYTPDPDAQVIDGDAEETPF